MRVVTCFLLAVVLVAGVFFLYVYQGAKMEIVGVVGSLTPATEALATYNDTRAAIADGSFTGKTFHQADFLMPDSYAFLTLTVRMKNPGLLPMDWIRVEVVSDASDIAQLYEPRTPSLAGGNRADFSAVLLTRAGVDTQRSLHVTYYVLGRAFTAEYDVP